MKAKAVHAVPLLLIFVFILSFGSGFIPKSIIGEGNDPYLVTSLIQLFVLALPALIFCRLRGGGFLKRLRIKMFNASHSAFLLFALLFMFFGSCGINFLMHYLFPAANVPISYESDGFAGGLYLVLTMAVIPAITEEFLFRGVVLAEYESEGVPAAVFMSAVTFAMIHFNFARLPAHLFCGLVLVMVVYTTRSLFAAILVHMLNNTATLFFGDLVYRVVSSQGMVLFCFILVSLILLFAILTFSECERIYSGYGVLNKDSSYTGKRKKGLGTTKLMQSVFTPFFLLLIIIYAIIGAVNL